MKFLAFVVLVIGIANLAGAVEGAPTDGSWKDIGSDTRRKAYALLDNRKEFARREDLLSPFVRRIASHIRDIDLNADGRDELIVGIPAMAKSAFVFYLYARVARGYRLIGRLEGEFLPEPLVTRSAGYQDLLERYSHDCFVSRFLDGFYQADREVRFCPASAREVSMRAFRCAARGGEWSEVTQQCILRTSDGGVPCRDAAECEWRCDYVGPQPPPPRILEDLQHTVGRCSASNARPPCFSLTIKDGRLWTVPCVD